MRPSLEPIVLPNDRDQSNIAKNCDTVANFLKHLYMVR